MQASNHYLRELDAALEVARAGGRIALGHFRKQLQTKQKADGTWVTEADWAVEAQIRLRLARAFPGHNVLGEEEGLTAAGGGPPVDGAPTWVVDPIDGTNNYMSGIPIWATLVALQVDARPVVGVAHAPALGETYDAATDAGARCNGETIAVDPLATLDRATVLFSSVAGWHRAGLGDGFAALTEKAWRNRGLGDFWGHVLVARGAAHVMAEPDLSVWDVAALQPIVSEAGGRITGLDGGDWTEGPCITTNGPLHDEVLTILRQG
ncbi:MAG TPA: inositol monophosphatase family protein [Actinomycetota bacterium]|nr:inositol monophosphatase family protein [Actinomycetota bacterium]